MVLYANAAVLVRPYADRGLTPRLPVPYQAVDFFWLFNIFTGYESVNHEYAFWALTRSRDGRDRWVRLDDREFLPFVRGERLLRVSPGYRFGGDVNAAHRDTQALLVKEMKARANRLHPHRRISKLLVYERTWPRLTRGFLSRDAGHMTSRLMLQG